MTATARNASRLLQPWWLMLAAATIILAGVGSNARAEQRSASPVAAVRTAGEAARPTAAAAVQPVRAADAAAIAARWGIRIDGVRLSASGYMLDFRYRVVDARKAKPLFDRRARPVLRDEATGAQTMVPTPPKTGALRSSNDPKAGRSYFMFFANPARFIQSGNTVTVTVGAFSVEGLRVE